MIRAIYARIPTEMLECRGFCHDSCGTIGLSAAETKMITYKHGSPPRSNFEHTGRSVITATHDITCDKLDDGKRCSIYDNHPAVCRLYGLMPALPCAHGCRPKQWISDGLGRMILMTLDDIEGRDERSHALALAVAMGARKAGLIE